jgi:hypothetical protein
MALTDFSDIYAALHDAGINRVVKRIMRHRPSLFNYGTENVSKNPSLWCSPIDAAPAVAHFMTTLDPLPIVAVENLGLDFCIQLTDFKMDFYPSNTISLPPQLIPLATQNFAIKLTVCAGVSCIPKNLRKTIPTFVNPGKFGTLRSINKQFGTGIRQTMAENPLTNTVQASGMSMTNNMIRTSAGRTLANPSVVGSMLADPGFRFPGIRVFPVEKLECFCLSVFVTGSASITGAPTHQRLNFDVNKIEIVDITPTGLENILECYLLLVLEKGIIPQALPGISEMMFAPLSLGPMGELVYSASTTAPHNPAVEDNQLKVFVNLDTIDLTIPAPAPGDPSPAPWPDPVSKFIPTRARTDAFDLTVAINETTLREVFQILGNSFTFSKYDEGTWGPFYVGYGIAVSVRNCNLELRSDHKMTISLNVNVDTLYLNLGIDIPEFTIPGFCLIPPFFPKKFCEVWIPETSFFSATPDILLPLDISGILSAALTITAAPVFYYGNGSPNRWMLFIDADPSLTSIEIDDIGDIPATLFSNAVDAAIASLGLPGWAEDAIEAVFGPIVDIITGILGIAGNAIVWIIDFIGDTLGLWDLLKAAVLDYIGDNVPLFQFQDPLPILPAATPEIEMTLPISYINATVYDTELVLTADIGG